MKCKYTPKISVIVAIYNVEQYIERCAISLLNQTLEDIEYIFIDDCSTDRSMDILLTVLEKFPHRSNSVKIIRNSNNLQIAQTRTIGMKAATGTYVIHCDPDDYVELDFFYETYTAAVNANADIVSTNYYRESKGVVKEVSVNCCSSSPKDCIKNMYRNNFIPFLWSHLIKRSLYTDNEIYPFEDVNTGEDLNVLLRIFDKAETICHLDRAFYHYVQRETSLTQNKDYLSLWNNNISKNLQGIIDYFQATSDNDYSLMLNYLKFTKKQVLLSTNPPLTELWYSTYKECRRDIMRFTCIPLLRRLLYLLFSYSLPVMNLYFRIRY